MYLRATNNPLDLPVVRLKIDTLSSLFKPHPVVLKQVKESLEKDGLLNPVVVVTHHVIEHKLPYYIEYHTVSNKNAQYFVHTGNNRYWLALELGYTEIDAYVCPKLKFLKDWEDRTRINPKEYPCTISP